MKFKNKPVDEKPTSFISNKATEKLKNQNNYASFNKSYNSSSNINEFPNNN